MKVSILFLMLLLLGCSTGQPDERTKQLNTLRAEVEQCFQARKNDEAIALLKKAVLSDLEKGTDSPEARAVRIACLAKLPKLYLLSGKPDEGTRFLSDLIANPPASLKGQVERHATFLLALHYANFNQRDKSLSTLEQARKIPSQEVTPNQRFLEYYTLALANMSDLTRLDQAFQYTEEAFRIDPALLDKDQLGNRTNLFSLMAVFYYTRGEYIRTFEISQDILRQVEKEGAPRQMVVIANLLSGFYAYIGMYPEANFYADMAIANARLSKEPILQSLACYSKYTALEKLGETDSVFHYLDLGEQTGATVNFPQLHFLHRLNRGKSYVQIPDSLESGIAILQKLHERPESYAGLEIEVLVPYYLGRGLLQKGEIREAETLFGEVEQIIRSPRFDKVDSETTDEVIGFLTRYYVDRQKPSKVLDLITRWMPVIEKKHNEDLLKGTASAHIKYQTEKKEQELTLLQSELKVKKLSIAVYIAIILLLVLVIAYGLLWWQQRKRQLRHLFDLMMRRHLEWKELNLALAEQQDMPQDEPEPLSLGTPEATGGTPGENGNQTEANRRLYHRVLLVMEREHPFLDPNLDLAALARLACTNRSQLSAALNQQTGSNFSAWLAEYRVNYLMEQLNASPGKSMDELYTEAGFPSRTSFYRQFRQITGLTPGQYMKQRER